ncbi:hypothetical protein O6H91_07G094500 [Diphasiastrum complanatum]|uniref:Uncharacterized protein n=1 Tax=Diphasiastrum complanatum TaxID=34168 RepID=A0ACC2D7Y4_DIPCM|nr:hypothetical protein O6H91_07G094500 [Diphasiastrum complanatum]
MDFSLGSMVSSGNAAGASEKSLASIASEMGEPRQLQQRMLSNSAMSPGSAGEMFIPSSSLKQRRSASELDSPDPRDDHMGPLKLTRTDSFSNRSQQDVKMMQPGSSGCYPALRNASTLPDARMSCSPTTSRLSEDALLNTESSYAAESRLLRGGDSLMSSAAAFLAGQSTPLRYFPSFQHDSYVQQHRPTSGLMHVGLHETAIFCGRHLFTATQWAELEHQALIFKYIMHGAPVPPELLLPIRRSLATMSGIPLPSQNIGNAGWGSFQLGVTGNVDPEPGRCRRTDGKKWRCSRPVVAEQKYCERHVHRGRHRKKAAEAQNASAAPSPSPKAASSPSAGRDISQNSPLVAETHHTLKPSSSPIASHDPHMINRTLSAQNLAAAGGIAVGTTSAGSLTCNQFPLPLHSASSLPSSKDHRFMNGINKANFGLRPEQLVSDFSGSTRELVDQSHHLSPALPSNQQLSWHLQSQKMPPSTVLKHSSSYFLQQDSEHDMKCFQGHEEMAYMADARRLNMLIGQHQHQHQLQQQQQQHHHSSSLFPSEPLNDDSKPPEGQPLRHFFDDWPRTRDSSTLSWSDAEEEKPKVNGSSTQLSISIPTHSSEIPASDSPTRGKTMFSPLRLSMLRNAEDVADPTHMGLGVGMGLGISSSHRQASWFPRALEHGVGGPLAEVLQSGAPHPGKKTSLNFLRELEWDANPNETPHIASPTGVLQKVTLGTCFSDSSSNASSPGSVRTEHAIAENQRLAPVLTNCSSRLST